MAQGNVITLMGENQPIKKVTKLVGNVCWKYKDYASLEAEYIIYFTKRFPFCKTLRSVLFTHICALYHLAIGVLIQS